jgi:hypothetical protein
MQQYVSELREAVDKAAPQLLSLRDTGKPRGPEADSWSRAEILGHLIDSAANNHRRFVIGQLEDNLVFPAYQQNGWVSVQRYSEAPWDDLVTLWASYNRHLARVMEAVPEEARTKKYQMHSFDKIAWKPVDEAEATTLDYLMKDYVDHLKNHLNQILGADWGK